MDATREDVPRVSVDTVHEWNRIKANYSGAALALLDETLAANGKGQLKSAILPHLNQFIEKTFQIARPNLRVNGRNFDDFDENDQEFEAFDEGLDRRIWSISEQCLQWDVDIAKKRRERPLEVERLMRDILQDKDEDVDQEGAMQELEQTLIFKDELPPHVEEISQKAFALAGELQQTIPVQSRRVASLQEVEPIVKSVKP